MACGVAVVASRAGGIGEVVEEGRSGILVPPGDSAGIADAIAELADDSNLRSALGGAARERVERDFSTGAMARKTIELYRDCLSRRSVNGGRG
jgi:starch synthase